MELPVSARRMLRRGVVTPGERMAGASLFPMFEPSGRVRRVLVVDHQQRRLYLPAVEQDLIHVPLLGPARFTRDAPAEQELCGAAAAVHGSRGLWHFDPWWVLSEPALAEHPATPVLKATNAATRSPGGDVRSPLYRQGSIRHLFYRRSLTEILWVAMRQSSSEGTTLHRWFSHWLPPRPARPSELTIRPGRPSRQPGWRLSPVWWERSDSPSADS